MQWTNIKIVTMLRFEARDEFFGSVFYDFKKRNFISFDMEATKMLKSPINTWDEDFLSQCKEFGLLTDEAKNYYFLGNKPMEGVLSAPLRLHLAYTARCNLRCAHCLGGNYVGNSNGELTFEEKVGIYDQMVDMGVHEVLIGGGEPFIDNTLIDFLKEGAKRHINQKVFTNGLLLNDELINEIKNLPLGYISVSMDGACDDSYYLVRGVRRFSDIIDACKALTQKVKYPVVIQVTATRANFGEIKEYLRLASEIGIAKLKIRPLKPGGTILKHSELVLSAEEYLTFIRTAQEEWNEKYKNKFILDYSWGNARLLFDENETKKILVENVPQPHTGYGCLAGKISMFVDPFGKVFPCVFLGSYLPLTKYEDVRLHSLQDIWTNGPAFTSLRNLEGNNRCKTCNKYAICRGGCIARTLYAKKSINDPDPWCIDRYFPDLVPTHKAIEMKG